MNRYSELAGGTRDALPDTMKLMAQTLGGLITLVMVNPALANTYVGIGLGGKPDVSGDLETSGAGHNVRGVLGHRFDGVSISIEAATAVYGLHLGSAGGYDARHLGAYLKYNARIIGNLELFGRAGVERSWLIGNRDGAKDFSGRGYAFGGGVEVVLPALGPGGGSVFWDWTLHRIDLGDTTGNASTSHWTIGCNASF